MPIAARRQVNYTETFQLFTEPGDLLRDLTILLSVLLLGLSTADAGDWLVEDAGRVVAIADVHGAYEAMVETLRRADVIDAELAWSGGATHLVVVGDLLDRGPRSRDAMDLLMRLESEAPLEGGKVLVLIGNHESMNLIGDLRYVSKSEYAAFAGDETEKERDRWFAAFAGRNNGMLNPQEMRQRFEQQFPAGFFALRRAFSPEGKYGKWLLEKPVIGVINGTAFVHGGLSPLVAELGLDGVNRDLKAELVEYVDAIAVLIEKQILLPTDSHYDTLPLLNSYMPALDESGEVLEAIDTAKRLANSELFHSEGPLWYRGNVGCGELVEEHKLEAALEAIGATRVVVGHTPTPSRKVLQRFDGRVIEIDTGMLNFYYKGSGNALVIEGDSIKVLNQNSDSPTSPLEHPRMVGIRPGPLSPEDLQILLERGEIVSREEDAAGRTIVKVSDGGRTANAIFMKRQRRGFYPGVAAYRLDRLLDLDLVPVTAFRKVGNTEGSLQFLTERYSDEARRSASGRGSSATCALPDQWGAMYVFDVLIYNEGRSMQRMLYDLSNWGLMLSEHDRAFSTRQGRPKHLKTVPIEVSSGWKAALSELTDEVLAKELDDVLDKRRIKALAARRDELLAEAGTP